MRRDITFNSKGLRCVGWLYVPDNLPAGQKAPAIVMAHGFSATKEMAPLDRVAEQFVNAGFVTLVFDYRFLGGSEGEPRCQVLWNEQIEDYRNAITWVSDQPEVDSDRIGVWGTSYSGAHVIWVSAYDRRVKAVVSQVDGGNAWDTTLRQYGPEGLNAFLEILKQDRIQRQRTGAVNYMPVTAPEGELAAIPGQEGYDWMMRYKVPSWRNEVTFESVEKLFEYDLTIPLRRISPTPLLIVLAEYEEVIPIDITKKQFEEAGEPKVITILPCGHFDVYTTEPWFSKATGAAVEWFKKHL